MLKKKIFDIIVCVHNSPHFLRWCLDSIFNHSNPENFNLLIVNDFSDDVTKNLIKEFQSKYKDIIEVITNKENLGYVKSANIGIQKSISENIILVNSDVIVTENWLEKFQDALKQDPKIGLISPLSNNAVNLTIKMPPGFDYIQMNEFLEKFSRKLYPDAMTVMGHCLLITRKVIETIGVFDEIYSPAYTEETDYHFLAINNGFRAVIADDTYVFHKGEGSIQNRNELLVKHLKIFFSRYKKQFKKLLAEYDRKDELGYLRDKKTQFPHFKKFFYKPHYDVVFFLPGLVAGIGGIATVVDIVNGLVLSGLNANIAYLGKKAIDMDMLFEPIQYDDIKQLLAFPPNTKVLIATEYGTVEAVTQIAKSHNIQSAYFLQDYEGWFEPQRILDFVKKTYHKIENRIVVSHWLKKMLEEQDKCQSTVINDGVPEDFFYPQQKIPKEIEQLRKTCKIIVLSLLSENERRGSVYFCQAMKELLQETTDIGFVVTQRSQEGFEDFDDQRFLNLGMLPRKKMPIYFSGCDIIVDSSLYHGFGLPALEGMSCGLGAIITDVQIDYAKNNTNCISVQPRNVRQIKEAILKLRDDPTLLSNMKKEARKTATEFSWKNQIPKFVKFFTELISSYDKTKSRPDFRYEKLLSYKDVSKVVESRKITPQPANYSQEIPSPRKIFGMFKFYSRQHGFLIACRESLKWLFK